MYKSLEKSMGKAAVKRGGGLLSSSQKISELVENGIGYVCGGQLHLELVSRRSD